jgi:uncharacterized protein (TIGR00661 family)
MGKIVYSMAGEGRGHATRVKTVVEGLRDEHEIHLLAPGDAFELLSPAYAGTDVQITRLPALRFGYGRKAGIDPIRTIGGGGRYFAHMPRLRRQVADFLRRTKPDLAIVDFEPILPRAASDVGVPFMSLDHQHVLVVSDFGELSPFLRFCTNAGALGVRRWSPGQSAIVVSSFYRPPLRPGWQTAQQVGVLLRPQIASRKGEMGDHFVAYFRRAVNPNVIDALERLGKDVRVYGAGELPPRGKVSFRPVSEQGFIDDLATSRALIASAGNQVVGEALHLGKPVLGVPEPMNFEQHVNAHFIEKSGAGVCVSHEGLTPAGIDDFTQRIDEFRARIPPDGHDGTGAALATIRRMLP